MSCTEFLSPKNCALALIDYQPAMYFGAQSHNHLSIIHNTALLAKVVRLFKITIPSTVAKANFSGPMSPIITDIFSQSLHTEYKSCFQKWALGNPPEGG